jgi:hypothetical protein
MLLLYPGELYRLLGASSFLIWFPYWKGCAFYNCSSFYTPIIVCHHNFLKSFWRIFHLYSYVPLYICMMITKILFYLAYIMSLLLYCFYPVHPHMQFLLYFKLEFLKNLQYLTNDSDFWSMVITLSMAFYVLFLLNGKYIWNLMHFKLLEFSF